MPARRRQRTRQTINKPMPKKVKYVFIGVLSVFIFMISFIWVLSSKAIDSDKFTIVYANGDDATAVVYDFALGEATKIIIPSDTYISSAYGYGDWRIASLPKLGEQEGHDGELLRLSLVKSLHFPVDAWVVGDIPSSNVLKVGRIFGQNSSLNIRQKMQLAMFVIRTPAQSWYSIDLADTSFISKEKLPDGEEGYVISRAIPPQLGTIFTIPIDDELLRVGIYDYTDKRGTTIKNLTESIHILGGDWAIIEKGEEDIDCIVRGENEMVVSRVSRVLVCEISTEKLEGNFDVEVVVGKKFQERF